jgi:hypothetical protein
MLGPSALSRKEERSGGRRGVPRRYPEAYQSFGQSDCSLASLSSSGRNSSLSPSSRLTSNATYLSPPKRRVIVPCRPSNLGLLRHSRTRTRVPRRRSLGPIDPAPFFGLSCPVVVTYVPRSGPTERQEAPGVSGLPTCIPSRSPVVVPLSRLRAEWDDRACIRPVVSGNPYPGTHGVFGGARRHASCSLLLFPKQ